MNRRTLLLFIGALTIAVILVCGFVLSSLFKYSLCDGDQVLEEMDTILQDAKINASGAPSEQVRDWALLTADSSTWRSLQQWMTNASGKYQLTLLALDQWFSPGDDAMVGVDFANGLNVECAFYNSTLESCSIVARIIPPEERDVQDMKTVLQAAPDHPTGVPPTEISWSGLSLYFGSQVAWKNLQQWMLDAPGSYQVETPNHEQHQCGGYVSYTVKARLSNGKLVACIFNERIIESCQEVTQ